MTKVEQFMKEKMVNVKTSSMTPEQLEAHIKVSLRNFGNQIRTAVLNEAVKIADGFEGHSIMNDAIKNCYEPLT